MKILDGVKDNPLTNDVDNVKEKNISGSWNKDTKKSVIWKANQTDHPVKPIHIQKVLEKPQTKFEQKVDNTNTPFKPQLENKPHALRPLAIYLETSLNGVHRWVLIFDCFNFLFFII